MIEEKQYFSCKIFVVIFGTSGPGVKSIQKIAYWDNRFSSVGLIKEMSLATSRESHWSCCKSGVTLISGTPWYSPHTNFTTSVDFVVCQCCFVCITAVSYLRDVHCFQVAE